MRDRKRKGKDCEGTRRGKGEGEKKAPSSLSSFPFGLFPSGFSLALFPTERPVHRLVTPLVTPLDSAIGFANTYPFDSDLSDSSCLKVG